MKARLFKEAGMILGIGLSLLIAQGLQAQANRSRVGYEAIDPEEELVKKAVRIFETRFSLRDVVSLTGQFEDDVPKAVQVDETTYRRIGPIKPIKRNFITTASEDYTIEKRRIIRSDLREYFKNIPDFVRIYFQPHSVTVHGSSATVEAVSYFRAPEFDTPESRLLTSRPATPITMHLRKSGDRWLVADLEAIAAKIAASIQK